MKEDAEKLLENVKLIDTLPARAKLDYHSIVQLSHVLKHLVKYTEEIIDDHGIRPL